MITLRKDRRGGRCMEVSATLVFISLPVVSQLFQMQIVSVSTCPVPLTPRPPQQPQYTGKATSSQPSSSRSTQ
ncbi:hypothetical protein E2C01_029610 [Portunus trituberculatus]|uniref:Uncharacterized protein n=1 Tax=Portunus trituberculatus TaxID=210409 RepID=A0A5B7EPT3_PORTR|nr:hypothetical protein [Portunus trituberculatus]